MRKRKLFRGWGLCFMFLFLHGCAFSSREDVFPESVEKSGTEETGSRRKKENPGEEEKKETEEMQEPDRENLDSDNEEKNAAAGKDDQKGTGTVSKEAENEKVIDTDNDSSDGTPGERDGEKFIYFVDVFGEGYTAEINPDIVKSPYLPENFTLTENGPVYEDDVYTSRMGIDVSRHQGEIDWKSVKEDGIEFAFIRIGYRGYGWDGKVYLDERFHQNIKNAQSEGLDVGVYFFSQAVNEEEALEEAEFVIGHLEEYELQLPVVYDPEHILDAAARTDEISGAQFTANTKVFCERIRQAGYDVMIYSNMLWEAFEFDLAELSKYPIWYADYEPLPQTPYMFEFWQYTNEGYVRGIAGEMDRDIQIMPITK